MNNNPFLSRNFTSIWSKHFYQNRTGLTFKFIKGPSFFKPSILPLYISFGKNLTKGISYTTMEVESKDFAGKAFLIYDVPEFFKIDTSTHPKNLKLYKIKQYPGFLIDLEAFTNFNHYMSSTFSKSSRYKLNKYKKRLEGSFDINYKMLLGDISKEEYDHLFKYFKKLLQRRFLQKQITNNNLDPKEWDFYRDVAYPMIVEKKASLFVIYERQTPIGITLNYHSDKVVFDAITVFDIDYSKFHLGSVTIMKLIEWCLENNYKILDFSKGYFDYKTRWTNKTYDFEYHIWYDSKTMSASLLAYFIKSYLNFKQKLRENNVNTKLHKFSFFLKNTKTESTEESIPNYRFSEPMDVYDFTKLKTVPIDEEGNERLKPMVFDFLYLNSERLQDTSLYKIQDNEDAAFVISGKNLCQKIYMG